MRTRTTLQSIIKNLCGVVFIVLVGGCRERLKETPHISQTIPKSIVCGQSTIECSSLIQKSGLASVSSKNRQEPVSELRTPAVGVQCAINAYAEFLPLGAVVTSSSHNQNTTHIVCSYTAPGSLRSVRDVFSLLHEWYCCEMERNGWHGQRCYTSDTVLWLMFKKPQGTLCQVMFEPRKTRGMFSSKMSFVGTLIIQSAM